MAACRRSFPRNLAGGVLHSFDSLVSIFQSNHPPLVQMPIGPPGMVLWTRKSGAATCRQVSVGILDADLSNDCFGRFGMFHPAVVIKSLVQ